MTSQSSIVKKASTLLNKMIYIMFKYTMHLHDHQNEMYINLKGKVRGRFNLDPKEDHMAPSLGPSLKV
jgi:hypothetical protein